MIKRGGNTEAEREHGKLLLAGGASEIWGWGTPAGKERVRRRVAWLRQACRLRPGVKALECGCGIGLFSRELAESGAEITAVDISPDLLQRARQECTSPDLAFVLDNLENPSALEDNYFDALCGISILHHLNLPQALAALRPKCKPGAKFAFSEPNILNPINKYYMFVPDPEKRKARGISPSEMAFHPEELRSVFTDAGYIVERLSMRDFLHPSIPRLFIPVFDFAGRVAEVTPLLKLWSGSIWIQGRVS
jgi:2-polyprenyl-3-methyl-5-hydroxy-6-metoxy-1,4-benzoquinol methylase